MSARLSAKGVAKSSGSAEIAKEAEMVAAENFITVSLLSSTLSRELWTKFDSGSRAETTKKESAATRISDRILTARMARCSDSILFSPSSFQTWFSMQYKTGRPWLSSRRREFCRSGAPN